MEPFFPLIMATGVLLIALPACGRILGGERLASRILNLEKQAAKAILAAPFLLAGKLLVWIGKEIRR